MASLCLIQEANLNCWMSFFSDKASISLHEEPLPHEKRMHDIGVEKRKKSKEGNSSFQGQTSGISLFSSRSFFSKPNNHARDQR